MKALMILAAILAGAKLILFIAASELAEERDMEISLENARKESEEEECAKSR